ncbi:MAG: hypothetical protein EXX96DRAFT_594399 [Benjaminiella poitrasii]|nr:MAG: hypothetical protein EXX96DRAFT_594399 [Benjaminiella poitrasii]
MRKTIRKYGTEIAEQFDLAIDYNTNFVEILSIHLIDMQWIEKNAPTTETTKWDGIAFKVDNKLVTPLFVELSGGVEFNSDMKLYFESLSLFDECFVKRTYFTTVCPTTPRALQEFLKCTQLLYQHREALLKQIN